MTHADEFISKRVEAAGPRVSASELIDLLCQIPHLDTCQTYTVYILYIHIGAAWLVWECSLHCAVSVTGVSRTHTHTCTQTCTLHANYDWRLLAPVRTLHIDLKKQSADVFFCQSAGLVWINAHYKQTDHGPALPYVNLTDGWPSGSVSVVTVLPLFFERI